jgi:hypothetical protein
MKYPLTDKAKKWASRIAEYWDTRRIPQYFVIVEWAGPEGYHYGGLEGEIPNQFRPPLPELLELASFNLVKIEAESLRSDGVPHLPIAGKVVYCRRWHVLLLQELRNAVESDFEVSDYFLTINAVGTIIQAGATVSVPFQSAAVGYGSLSQSQTAENSQVAEKLIQMLGKQFLESNGEIVKAINEFRESTESERQSKLGNVISQLGNSLQHGANAFAVSQALIHLAPLVSQIIT